MMVHVQCSLASDIYLIDAAFAVDLYSEQVGTDARHFNFGVNNMGLIKLALKVHKNLYILTHEQHFSFFFIFFSRLRKKL